ncbi:MAG: hypothetical protein E5Y70_26520 [Mesorhizobium sp.]|uniref:hypothetical protein n=1 Tax=Mesorhizobium sp. TaxID=1871066 RepID=UPI0011F80A16|nr:hypothetical protein [Mesorhizobium sp.]TIL71337.1 MAG: hypothetical protein E5Y70_26520 [Mesorhizobium sp.]
MAVIGAFANHQRVGEVEAADLPLEGEISSLAAAFFGCFNFFVSGASQAGHMRLSIEFSQARFPFSGPML